jgi:hypothetical protein
MLQWLAAPQKSLTQIAGLLKEDGCLHYAVFCKGSYAQLAALQKRRNLPQPVWFCTVRQLNAMLAKAGFTNVQTKRYAAVKYFTSAHQALRQISGAGATATGGPQLLRGELTQLCREYEQRYKTRRGVPVSYTVALGTARKERSSETL